MHTSDPDILYIASTSRSGSTLLDQTIGQIEAVYSVGELHRLKDFANLNLASIRELANQKGCTCGKKISDCEFWSSIAQEAGLELARVNLNSQAGALDRALFKTSFFLAGSSFTKWVSRFYRPFQKEIGVGENCFKIYSAIAKVTQCKVIVDSSKQVHQYVLLKVARPDQVKLLALFRDGRAVSKAVIRGERLQHFRNGMYSNNVSQAFKAAIRYWVNANLQILLFYLRTSQKDRLWINYEDFCREPKKFIERMQRQFHVKGAAVSGGSTSKMCHNIGGSPSRFSFDLDKIVLDTHWKKDWKVADRKTFACYGAFLNRILGYKD